MLFEHDVFISYPHLSNRDDQSGQNGWVAKFHNDLKNCLTENLGKEPRIWRDNKMPLGTVFGKAICDRLAKAKVLLCVLSPAYQKSSWCMQELNEFCARAAENGGLTIDEQSRIITVVKCPVEQTPDKLASALYCEFFDRLEDRGQVPRPFSQFRNGYKYKEYERLVHEIAWAIKLLLDKLPDKENPNLARTIFLAETSSDREGERERMKNELEARKFIVLPQAGMPNRTFGDYARSVREQLRQSFMSIHLLGENYGVIPENAQGKSIVEIQNELASQRSREDPLFRRIIWIPKILANPEVSQVRFLDALRADENALLGAEMIERPFEDLKTRLLQILVKKQPERKVDNLVRIYLMCDRQDDDSVEPVGRFLFQKGYEVILPPEKKGTSVLKYHKNNLLTCDAALTIYGKAKYEWVQDRYDDVVAKVRGWGRSNDISCSAILPTDPENTRKRTLFFIRTKILPPCYNGLSDSSLEVPLNEFIDELDQCLRRLGSP